MYLYQLSNKVKKYNLKGIMFIPKQFNYQHFAIIYINFYNKELEYFEIVNLSQD